MKRNPTLSALCVSVALLFASGCAPDAVTPSGPDPQFDQKGLGAGGQLDIFRFVAPFDVSFPPFTVCAFPIRFEGVDKVIVQVFQTHVAIHVNSKATVTNLDNGLFFQDNEVFTQIVHLDDGTLTVIGAPIKITLPGEGMLFQDTGIITFDPSTGDISFEAGPHEVFHGANPCDGLVG
ncbi:MAG: hypothetical protein IIA27_15040 [Gemmatimonadetes bacterium]|nr:hypothetical protein [Gemmatimonadota bacterium]